MSGVITQNQLGVQTIRAHMYFYHNAIPLCQTPYSRRDSVNKEEIW